MSYQYPSFSQIEFNMKYVFTLVCILATLPVWAQTPEATVENPRKELNKLMKELPVEAQLKVLSYAQKTQAAVQKMEETQAEMAAAPAVPAGQPAQPEQPQPLQLKPTPQPTTPPTAEPAPAPPAIQQPARPAYLTQAEEATQTTVEFPETQYEFGKTEEGSKVAHTFEVKNTGEEPLILTYVRASCGCTTPRWSREPIQPGETGSIDVVFNSSGKRGMQNKTITVVGNFQPRPMVLRLRGEVVPKPAPSNE